MIDTHAHIYAEEFDDDILEVVLRAQKAGISRVILANVDVTSIERLKNTYQQFPQFCAVAMGLHPTSIGEDYKQQLQVVKNELFCHPYCAVGEIGIDLFWDDTYLTQQLDAFEQQLNWAIELKLPLIIHVRKAFPEVFSVLNKYPPKTFKGVFHCFSGGVQEAIKAVQLGFKLGIGGVVTYKNSHLPQILEQIKLEDLLLETDAPYLAPVPYRGKRNEPSYLIEVLYKLSEVYKLHPSEIDKITNQTAQQLFNFK